jgi:YfiH family protein
MTRLHPLQAASLSAFSPTIKHGFFTREGGISDPPLHSLNCALTRGVLEQGLENRRRISAYFDHPLEYLCCMQQLHGNQVHVIDSPYDPLDPVQGDGLITNVPGLILGVLTADCVPILIADPVSPRIAAIHAGWRGLQSGVIEATLERLVQLGSDLRQCIAVTGPCIAGQNYEVGSEVKEAFVSTHPERINCFQPTACPSHFLFDLRRCAQNILETYHLKTVEILTEDTYSLADEFFSCRRSFHQGESMFGNQLSALCINPT